MARASTACSRAAAISLPRVIPLESPTDWRGTGSSRVASSSIDTESPARPRAELFARPRMRIAARQRPEHRFGHEDDLTEIEATILAFIRLTALPRWRHAFREACWTT